MTHESTVTPLASGNTTGVTRGPGFRLLVIGLVLAPLALALYAGFPLCPSAGLFGLPCPGCGLTRATLLLLSGEFSAAYGLHPLVIPLAPLYFGAFGAVILDYLRGPRGPRPAGAGSGSLATRRWVTVSALVLLVLTFGLWGARFLGMFGGPVAVESYGSWAQDHAPWGR